VDQKYKIVFYGEGEETVTISEMEFKKIAGQWESVTAVVVRGELYAKSSIKKIVKVGLHQEALQLEEPEPKGIPRELADKIKNDHINRMNCEQKD
jgi:hypothetical protein